MSKRELERVEVLARVRSKQLRLVDAGQLMQVSYRQAKRLWKRYREEGAAGLQHRSAGQPSHHGHERKFRQKVLQLVREKYGVRWGNGLGRRWRQSTWRARMVCRWTRKPCAAGCWLRVYGVGSGNGDDIGGGGAARDILGGW